MRESVRYLPHRSKRRAGSSLDHQLRDSTIATINSRAEDTASRVISDSLAEFGRLVNKLSGDRFTGKAVIGLRVENGHAVSGEVDSEEVDGVFTVSGDPAIDPAKKIERFREAIVLAKRSGLFGHVRNSLYFRSGVIVGGGLLIRRTFR